MIKTIVLIIFVFFIVIILIGYYESSRLLKKKHRKTYELDRHESNPILSPLHYNAWEAIARFNPASFLDHHGRVHLLYRAIGHDGVSRIGYASSDDGVNFDSVCSYPIFLLQNPRKRGDLERYDPVMYPSGGSWGGCEDPRITKIDDTLYLCFNAFDGWDFIRICVSSIKESDFLAQKWNWTKPLFISPVDQIHKNWVLFPEKINGKFAILHSMFPKVEVDYVDDLKDLDTGREEIVSPQGPRMRLPPTEHWDSWIRGAGAPPLKTKKGWLVLYHGVDKNETHKYKIGAMLLDLQDPTKIIARSPGPILEPDAWYENDGKPGIVYVCGAIIKDENLVLYYGAGDKHTAIAQTPLNELLAWVLSNKK